MTDPVTAPAIRSRSDRLGLRAAAATGTAPFLVLIARSFHAAWLATSDFSLIEARTSSVGGADTPLIGPYSRFGWNHPGPALFYALAAPYRLLASNSTGLLAGTAIIGAVAVVAIVVALLRAPLPRSVAMFGLLLTAILVRALSAGFLWNPWNPYVIVLPFLALVVVSLWIANGEDRALPLGIALATFVAQTHVSIAAAAAALLAVALAWLVVAAVREPENRPRLRRSVLLSLGVGGLMWSPPIWQQLQAHGGNLLALWKFWTHSHHDTVGLADGARLFSRQLALPAPWMGAHESVNRFNGALKPGGFSFPIALVALVAAFVVARRRHDRLGLIACSLAATAVLVSAYSFGRIVGPPYPYLVRWAWVVGALCWFAVGVALLPVITERIGRSGTEWLTRAIAGVAAVLVLIVAVGAFTADPPAPAASRTVRALVAQALPRLRKLPGPLLFVTSLDYDSLNLRGGVVVGAAEHGIDARYPSSLAFKAGKSWVVKTSHAGTVLDVVLDQRVAAYEHNSAYREIARLDELTPAERREFDRFEAALAGTPRSRLKQFLVEHQAEIRHFDSLKSGTTLAAIFERVANRGAP